MDLKSAKGYAGNFNGVNGGIGSYTWANEDNKHELWKGMYSKTTWTAGAIGYSKGGGFGAKYQYGANLYWGKSTIMNNGKPLLNIYK